MLSGILNNAYLRQQVMTRLSNKAPGNSAPILPIEGAVTVGRSYWGNKRGGFLEFQERIFEEVVTAVVWLFGVRAMSKGMDWLVEHFQKKGNLRGIYSQADWSKDFMQQLTARQKKPSILLSPLERFSHSFGGLKNTMLLKGLKWIIAVTVPMVVCGYVIPKVNQLKTDWLLKKYYGGHPAGEKAKPETSSSSPAPEKRLKSVSNSTVPATPVEDLAELMTSARRRINNTVASDLNPSDYTATTMPVQPYGTGMGPSSYPAAPYSYPYNAGYGQYPAYGTYPRFYGQEHSASPGQRPRFGSALLTGLSKLSQVGHWVNNTAYGEVLVVDAAISGGRVATAWPRSPFESLEIVLKEIGNLFFYLMSVPLIMDLSSKAMNTGWFKKLTQSVFKRDTSAVINLDEQVGHRVNQALVKQLGNQPVTAARLNELLNGQVHPEFGNVAKQLRKGVLQAPVEAFKTLAENQALGMTRSPQELKQTQSLLKLLQKDLTAIVKPGESLTAEQLESLLRRLANRQGLYKSVKGVSDAALFNVQTAVKLAFHQHAGLSGLELEKQVLSHLAGKLTSQQQEALVGRLRLAAKLGGGQSIATALRSSLNAAHLTQAMSHATAANLETVVRCVERATLENVPLETFVRSKLDGVLAGYAEAIKGQGGKVAKNASAQRLAKGIAALRTALKEGNAISPKSMETLAQLLETNGRTYPRMLRWLQGQGLGHLAEDLRLVAPLLDGKTPIDQVMSQRILGVTESLAKLTAKHPHQQRLIQTYGTQIQRLLTGKALEQEGRFAVMLTRSMAGSPKAYVQQLDQQIARILKGGIQNSETLYRMGLGILNRMPTEAEHFFEETAMKEMKGTVNPYLRMVQNELGAHLKKTKRTSIAASEFATKVLQPLGRRNAMWRYGVWGAAITASMVGVGILIPQLQFWVTRLVTGSNEHPGLVAASKKMGTDPAPLHHT